MGMYFYYPYKVVACLLRVRVLNCHRMESFDLDAFDKLNIVERSELLSKLINRFEADILKPDTPNEEFKQAKEILKVSLCRITKLLVPNVQRKIDEISTADELNLIVSKSERGADMLDEFGNKYELKVSVCSAKKSFKSNFNWPIPKCSDTDLTRKKLLEQVIEKTGGVEGGAYFIAKTKKGVIVNKYFINGALMYSFFEHLPLHNRSTYNFGSARCNTCHKYHRLEKFLDWHNQSLLVTAPDSELYERVKSQCV